MCTWQQKLRMPLSAFTIPARADDATPEFSPVWQTNPKPRDTCRVYSSHQMSGVWEISRRASSKYSRDQYRGKMVESTTIARTWEQAHRGMMPFS